MKRLVATHGQHFLRSTALIGELVGHSNIRKNDVVVDLGAGSGAITAVLARRARAVIAVENEPRALEVLRSNMAGRENVTVVDADILQFKLPDGSYKVFANIPFALSSQLVRRLTSAVNPPRSIYLIVQRQFAQKLLIDSDHFHGALGMMIGPWWMARIRRPLRRNDFTPPPAVDTVLLEVKPRETPLLPATVREEYWRHVERSFAEPKYYASLGGDARRKPSQLQLEDWLRLTNLQPR